MPPKSSLPKPHKSPKQKPKPKRVSIKTSTSTSTIRKSNIKSKTSLPSIQGVPSLQLQHPDASVQDTASTTPTGTMPEPEQNLFSDFIANDEPVEIQQNVQSNELDYLQTEETYRRHLINYFLSTYPIHLQTSTYVIDAITTQTNAILDTKRAADKVRANPFALNPLLDAIASGYFPSDLVRPLVYTERRQFKPLSEELETLHESAHNTGDILLSRRVFLNTWAQLQKDYEEEKINRAFFYERLFQLHNPYITQATKQETPIYTVQHHPEGEVPICIPHMGHDTPNWSMFIGSPGWQMNHVLFPGTTDEQHIHVPIIPPDVFHIAGLFIFPYDYHHSGMKVRSLGSFVQLENDQGITLKFDEPHHVMESTPIIIGEYQFSEFTVLNPKEILLTHVEYDISNMTIAYQKQSLQFKVVKTLTTYPTEPVLYLFPDSTALSKKDIVDLYVKLLADYQTIPQQLAAAKHSYATLDEWADILHKHRFHMNHMTPSYWKIVSKHFQDREKELRQEETRLWKQITEHKTPRSDDQQSQLFNDDIFLSKDIKQLYQTSVDIIPLNRMAYIDASPDQGAYYYRWITATKIDYSSYQRVVKDWIDNTRQLIEGTQTEIGKLEQKHSKCIQLRLQVDGWDVTKTESLTPPPVRGDLVFDRSANQVWRWTGTVWELSDDHIIYSAVLLCAFGDVAFENVTLEDWMCALDDERGCVAFDLHYKRIALLEQQSLLTELETKATTLTTHDTEMENTLEILRERLIVASGFINNFDEQHANKKKRKGETKEEGKEETKETKEETKENGTTEERKKEGEGKEEEGEGKAVISPYRQMMQHILTISDTKLSHYMLFQLIANDLIQIGDYLYSKKTGEAVICSHYMYDYWMEINDNQTLKSELLTKYGTDEDNGIICRVCGVILGDLDADIVVGFTNEGQMEKYGDVTITMEIDDTDVEKAEKMTDEDFMKDFPTKLHPKYDTLLLRWAGLRSIQSVEYPLLIEINRLIDAYVQKIGPVGQLDQMGSSKNMDYELKSAHHMEVVEDVFREFHYIQSYDAFKRGYIKKLKQQGADMGKLRRAEERGLFEKMYRRYHKVRHISIVVARILVVLQTTYPAYHIINPIRSPLLGIDGDNGIDYMVHVTHQMDLIEQVEGLHMKREEMDDMLKDEIKQLIEQYRKRRDIDARYLEIDRLRSDRRKILAAYEERPTRRVKRSSELRKSDFRTMWHMAYEYNHQFTLQIQDYIYDHTKNHEPIGNITELENACCITQIDQYKGYYAMISTDDTTLTTMIQKMQISSDILDQMKMRTTLNHFIGGTSTGRSIDNETSIKTRELTPELIRSFHMTYCSTGPTAGTAHIFLNSPTCLKCEAVKSAIMEKEYSMTDMTALLEAISHNTMVRQAKPVIQSVPDKMTQDELRHNIEEVCEMILVAAGKKDDAITRKIVEDMMEVIVIERLPSVIKKLITKIQLEWSRIGHSYQMEQHIVTWTEDEEMKKTDRESIKEKILMTQETYNYFRDTSYHNIFERPIWSNVKTKWDLLDRLHRILQDELDTPFVSGNDRNVICEFLIRCITELSDGLWYQNIRHTLIQDHETLDEDQIQEGDEAALRNIAKDYFEKQGRTDVTDEELEGFVQEYKIQKQEQQDNEVQMSMKVDAEGEEEMDPDGEYGEMDYGQIEEK